MIKVSFFDNYSKNTVLSLGFFDAVHLGHVKVLSACVELSKKLKSTPFAFTFESDPSNFVSSKSEKLICPLSERMEKFSSLGIQGVLCAPCEKRFFDISPLEFLRKLKTDFSVKGIVCGYDYTFGAGKSGDAKLLSDFCSENDIELHLVDEVCDNLLKIGSRNIKQYILNGDIKQANKLLGYNYAISGVVQKGRGDGAKFTVPTINIFIPEDKVIPKSGVYLTKTIIDEKKYLSITNVGDHPTFTDFSENVETYLLDFNGDVYGKEVRVEFLEYIREIFKFQSSEDLKAQIMKDVAFARGVKND